jgi:hypothetical protein
MGDPRDEDKSKEIPPKETPPSISISPSISREEHLASLDTLKSSMRLEMKAMFEEYLGKKSLGLTDPNTTPSVDLPLAKVKPSNHGSPPLRITVPYLRKMMVRQRVHPFHPQTLTPLYQSIILCHILTTWDLLLSLILAISLNSSD